VSGRAMRELARLGTLALLTIFLGAKLGASAHRHGAMPGYVQQLSVRLNGLSGHTWHHKATLRKCLLSSRSRVRVAVGAHTRSPRSGSILPQTGHAVMMPSGAVVPVACPIASPSTGPAVPLPACSARPRWPAGARSRRAGTPSRPGSWSAPSAPSAPGDSRPRPASMFPVWRRS